MEYFYRSKNAFESFSLEHLLVLVGFVVFAALVYYFANKFLTSQSKWSLGVALSTIPLIFVLLRMYVESRMGEFTYLEDLPLFICRLVSFLLPIMFIRQSKGLFGVLYFWVMAGTSNAVITPDLNFGLPHFESIFYWLIHNGLIVSILYAVFVLEWSPEKRDVWRAFWWGNAYLILVHGLNCILDSNYSYTMHKPPGGSILDLFGPWPLYLITGQLLALGLFWLFYIPFIFKKK